LETSANLWAEAPANLKALRGAEAPLFHGIESIREPFRNLRSPALPNASQRKRFTLPNPYGNQYILIGTNFHDWLRSLIRRDEGMAFTLL
jgi:hypothetical protein